MSATRPNSPHLVHRARQALERGQAQGFAGAIFDRGQDVLCVRLMEIHGAPQPCAGYLYTLSQDTWVLVKPYDVREFNERRAVCRGNFRCHRCEGRLEVESHVIGEAAA